MIPDALFLPDSDDRPELSGAEEVVFAPDNRFAVHFTRTGADAVAGGDADGDGVPDAVTRTLGALAGALATWTADGWRDVPTDRQRGPALDVYVRALDINGYAHAVPPLDPADPSACWMELDNQLADLPGKVVESVSVHELHHCVEFTYSTDVDGWLLEATATEEQYEAVLDDPLSLALGVLYGERLGHPERPIDATDGRFEYAGFLVVKFGRDRTAGPHFSRTLWETLADEPDWRSAFATVADDRLGVDADRWFLENAVWNSFACAADDGAHYDAAHLPCVVATQPPSTPIEDRFEISFESGPYASFTGVFDAAGDASGAVVTCTPVDGALAAFGVVAVDASGRGGAFAAADAGVASLEGPIDAAGTLRVVAVSSGPATATCAITRPEPARGCATATAGAPALAWLLAGLLRRRQSTATPCASM